MSTERKHRVQLTTEGITGRLLLDGNDVSDAVRAITITAGGGEVPMATLDIFADDGDVTLASSFVQLTDKSHALMVQLGWTPPKGPGYSIRQCAPDCPAWVKQPCTCSPRTATS